MTVICSLLLLVYMGFISWLVYGFLKMRDYAASESHPETRFSIVVPFRNEAQNLPDLLESLSKVDYPVALFEVILVDDDSNDGFQIGHFEFQITVIKNVRISDSPKKDAITTAVSHAKNHWIITTDADCIAPLKWLKTLDSFIRENNPEMIAGAIQYQAGNSFLNHFQQLDIASLQGATIGSFGIGKPFMCNGANFAYSKNFFYELNGFEGNSSIAGGDDVFMLQKAASLFPENIRYLKSRNAIVATKTVTNWKSMFNQRVRWATKANSYESLFGKWLALVVFGGNIAWIFMLAFVVLGILPWFFTVMLLGKIAVDFVLISLTNHFLKTKNRGFILASLAYPFFSVAVAVYSLFGKYEWKGRKFQK